MSPKEYRIWIESLFKMINKPKAFFEKILQRYPGNVWS